MFCNVSLLDKNQLFYVHLNSLDSKQTSPTFSFLSIHMKWNIIYNTIYDFFYYILAITQSGSSCIHNIGFPELLVHVLYSLPYLAVCILVKLITNIHISNSSWCYSVIFLNRDKKNRGYSSGKRMFKLSAAAKKKPRRHNTEVSVWKNLGFVTAVPDVQIFVQ